MLIENNFRNNFFYDDKKIIKCSYCNNIIFYINDYIYHKCPIEKKGFKINKDIIKDKDSKFICDINNINNMCVLHKNNKLLYFKDSNYYCQECIKENKINKYINLEEIELSNEEINDFKKLINDCEIIHKKIKDIYEKYINELKDSYENFEKRNKLLINYCKGLINYSEENNYNYNLISTIRRISIDINIIQFKKIINKDLIYFYNDKNIIKFNNDLNYDSFFKYSYFQSENILNKGKYYLGESINKGSFGEVSNALSIKDKKIVAIKKLSEKEFKNEEIDILKTMNECEYSVKYYGSFKEKNNIFIVTELCNNNLRNEINNKKNGFTINEIKKIFCQLNEVLKILRNKDLLHRDLKPDNILIIKNNNNNNTKYYKYKLCDYGVTKYSNNTYYSTFAGTLLYLAPEVKNNKYSNKSDLFSIGIILYELYYGNKDCNLTQDQILSNIEKGLKIKKNNNNNEFNIFKMFKNEDDNNEFNDLKNLIEECLKKEEKRINWDNYFNHKFFNYEIEIILNIKDEDIDKNIKLIEFNKFNESNTELYINNKKETFKNYYKFNKIGDYIIKFIFNNNIIDSSLEKMFYECKNIIYIKFNIFNTSNVKNMKEMFSNCNNLKELNLSSFNTSNVKNMEGMFSNCNNLKEIDLSSFNTSNVENMEGMFSNCYNLKEIDLYSFNTSNVENMEGMFYHCNNLKEIDLFSFNTSKVKYMKEMFRYCQNLKKLDLSSFQTSNLLNIEYIFSNCENLKEIDLSTFNTSNVENMEGIFSYCHNLKEIDLSSFNTSNVKNMEGMFSNCLYLKKINLVSFNTINVQNMEYLFYNCYNLKEIDLSSFDFSNVNNMEHIILNCNNLKILKIKEEFKNKLKKIINNNDILF